MFELPIYIKDYKKENDPIFDNDNYGYTSKNGKVIKFEEGEWSKFADAIGDDYGALDLLRNRNITTIEEWINIKPGNLIGYDRENGMGPVSYTHLTLPTIYSV